MSKITKTSGNRQAKITKKAERCWLVQLSFVGEIFVENAMRFATKKECLHQAEYWLEHAKQ